MMAVADFADAEMNDERKSPPYELQQAWEAKQWGLPDAGGRLDQPAGLIKRMSVALNVYNAWKGFHNARNISEWCDAYPDAWKIVEGVMELRKHAT